MFERSKINYNHLQTGDNPLRGLSLELPKKIKEID